LFWSRDRNPRLDQYTARFHVRYRECAADGGQPAMLIEQRALVLLPMSRGHDDAGTAHAVLTWAAERRGGQRGIVVPAMSLGAGHELTNRTDAGCRSRCAALYGATPRNRRRTGGGNNCSSDGRCSIRAGTSNWNRRGRSREVRDFSGARAAGELACRCQCGLRRGSIHLRRYDDSGG
jgi:hypothetical protein